MKKKKYKLLKELFFCDDDFSFERRSAVSLGSPLCRAISLWKVIKLMKWEWKKKSRSKGSDWTKLAFRERAKKRKHSGKSQILILSLFDVIFLQQHKRKEGWDTQRKKKLNIYCRNSRQHVFIIFGAITKHIHWHV